MNHASELLSAASLALTDSSGERDPGDRVIRMHRGLLRLASTAGFERAYEIWADPNCLRDALTDPTRSANDLLAVVRLDSGLHGYDAEAHFQLAVATLLAGNATEATAAITDCADHAAPYERRDFARRLTQLAAEHSDLGQAIADLKRVVAEYVWLPNWPRLAA